MFKRQNYFTITQVFKRQNYFTITQVFQKAELLHRHRGVQKAGSLHCHRGVGKVELPSCILFTIYFNMRMLRNSLPSVVSKTSPAAALLTGEPAGDRKTQSHTSRFAWVDKHQLTPVNVTVLCMATIPVLTMEETQLTAFTIHVQTDNF